MDNNIEHVKYVSNRLVESYYTKDSYRIGLLEINYNTDCDDITGDIEYEIADMFHDAFKTHDYKFTFKGKKLTFKCEISESDVNDGEIVIRVEIV